MNSVTAFPRYGATGLLCAALAIFAAIRTPAQDVQHLSITQPGGMPGMPLITSVQNTTNGVLVTWDGPPGYYQLFQSSTGGVWQAVGARTNLSRRATVTPDQPSAQFRVKGPMPIYGGARACAECHPSINESESQTAHPHALEALERAGQGNNPNCLPCHTVGYGVTNGFASKELTAHLAGVQCENCHGAAANHAANPDDFTVRPRVELAATACGGCHSGKMVPSFDEWMNSGHAVVTEDMNPAGRISSCGRCHSGSARLSLLNGKPLPAGDANVSITCAVCHDPHRQTGNPAQLRNPLASMDDYSLGTSDVFLDKYKANINVCAQCHNHRGASWNSTSRPPHHSPQYNMLLGTVGELSSGARPNDPAEHAFLEKQCVSCHMHTKQFTSEQDPAKTGHSFQVESYESCQECHPQPELLVEFTMDAVSSRIEEVRQALNLWATSKAPEALRTKYGTRAWEYTTPGSLSSGGAGPTSAEQALIPDNIKKARYNVYLVLHDGSFGVHNGPFAITLLRTATDWVQAELNK